MKYRAISHFAPLCIAALAGAALFIAFSPLATHAQMATGDLRATIRAQLLSDPRTSSLSLTELDAMVDILTQQAEMQGITPAALVWRPQLEQFASTGGASAAEDVCGDSPAFLCAFSEAFGFVGPDWILPFLLGLASMGLIWVIAHKLHHGSRPTAVQSPAPAAPITSFAP